MLTLPEGKFWYLKSDLGINTQKTLFEHTSVDSQSYQEILQVQAVAEREQKGEKKVNRAQRSALNLETRWSRHRRKGWNAWNVCEWRFRAAVPRRHAVRNANKRSALLLLHARLGGSAA